MSDFRHYCNQVIFVKILLAGLYIIVMASWHYLLKMKKIAVIGGGISSLSFILGLCKNLALNKNKIPRIDVYQKDQLGGRIKTFKHFETINQADFFSYADIGANFVDYESEQQKNYVLSNLSQKMRQNLRPFKQNFLLFQNGKLGKTQATKVKERYFYKDGFDKLIQDFRTQIQTNSLGNVTFVFQDVKSIKKDKDKWIVFTNNIINQQLKAKQYDCVVFGCHPTDTLKILHQHQIQSDKPYKIAQALRQIQFTQQMSAVLEFDPYNKSKAMQMQQRTPFYSILFLDSQSQITFICSHQEKYPENHQKLIVIQFNQALSKKILEIKKLHHNDNNQKVQSLIYQKIPQLIKVKYGIKQNIIGLHYWNESLLKPQSFGQLNYEIFDYFNSNFEDRIFFCGDFLNKKSRVSSSIKIGFQLSEVLSQKEQFFAKL